MPPRWSLSGNFITLWLLLQDKFVLPRTKRSSLEIAPLRAVAFHVLIVLEYGWTPPHQRILNQ